MGAPSKITPEVFEQVKKILSTNLFERKQVADMFNISKASVDQINTYHSLKELRVAQKAAWELTQQRRKEKEDREKAAAEAFQKALDEEQGKETPKSPTTPADPFDNPNFKMDVIIEKLDTLINLLKEVRIAQTAKPIGQESVQAENFLDKHPGFNEKPF